MQLASALHFTQPTKRRSRALRSRSPAARRCQSPANHKVTSRLPAMYSRECVCASANGLLAPTAVPYADGHTLNRHLAAERAGQESSEDENVEKMPENMLSGPCIPCVATMLLHLHTLDFLAQGRSVSELGASALREMPWRVRVRAFPGRVHGCFGQWTNLTPYLPAIPTPVAQLATGFVDCSFGNADSLCVCSWW